MDEQLLNYYYNLAKTSHIIYWAKKTLNWSPLVNEASGKEAWYQYVLAGCFVEDLYHYPNDYWDESLRGEPVRQFAWRIGRQCLKRGSLILTRQGELVKIEDSPNAWKTFDSKECFKIKAFGGYEIDVTGNHPIMTDKGWVNAENLKPGDFVQVLLSWDKFNNNKPLNEYAAEKINHRFVFSEALDGELCGYSPIT